MQAENNVKNQAMPHGEEPEKDVDSVEEKETFPLIDGIIELAEGAKDETISLIETLPENQQELLIKALNILAPIVERSGATHSAEYYRSMFVVGMPTLGRMTEDAQNLAAQIAVEKVRAACSAEDAEDDETCICSTDTPKDESLIFAPINTDLSANDENEDDDGHQETDGEEQEPTEKQMKVRGALDHVFIGTLSKDGILSLDALAFGNGETVRLMETDVSAVSNPNFFQTELLVASRSWDGANISVCISDCGTGDLLDEATLALNFIVKHMLGYGDAVVMKAKVRSVIGTKGCENPENNKDTGLGDLEEMTKALEEAEQLGFTYGDLMGAFFRCGKDWKNALEWLKALYAKDRQGED